MQETSQRASTSFHPGEYVSDIVGWHVAKKGDRLAALEPIRQGIREHFLAYAPKIALGLGLRHVAGVT